jgi:hypothetical protein
MAAGSSGYWLAGTWGAIGSFAAASYPSTWTPAPIVSMATTPSGTGFWLATSDGGVLSSAQAAAASGGSYALLGTDELGRPYRYDPCAPIRYEVNPAGAVGGASGVAEIHLALQQVEAATGLDFVYAGETDARPGRPARRFVQGRWEWAPVLIAWASAAEAPMLGGSVLGYGGSSLASAPGYDKAFVTGQVVLDTDLGPVVPGFGAGATRGNLVLHEVGHLVGLDHVGDAGQLMFGSLSPSSPPGFQGGDRSGLLRVGAAGGCLRVPPA